MRLSHGWQVISSIGHGVLLALALSGAVHIGGALMSRPVTPEFAGNVFLFGCLVFAPLTGAFNTGRWALPRQHRGPGKPLPRAGFFFLRAMFGDHA